jgi:hypothetical protein
VKRFHVGVVHDLHRAPGGVLSNGRDIVDTTQVVEIRVVHHTQSPGQIVDALKTVHACHGIVANNFDTFAVAISTDLRQAVEAMQ